MTEIEAAEARVATAKARLQQTVDALQERLQPRSIARSAAEGGREALAAGAESARANPGKVAGAVALVTAVLARHRIAALLRKAQRPAATRTKARRSARTNEDPTP